MATRFPLPDRPPVETPRSYRPGDPVWVYRGGDWRSGEVLQASAAAIAVRYRLTGNQGTGVDTLRPDRPELTFRTGETPPPPPRRPQNTATPGRRAASAEPSQSSRRRDQDRLQEFRVYGRDPGGRSTELAVRCAVDRGTGVITLVLPDGTRNALDIVLARAASLVLQEAVFVTLDGSGPRLWIQRSEDGGTPGRMRS